jgi:hypothetical protein
MNPINTLGSGIDSGSTTLREKVYAAVLPEAERETVRYMRSSAVKNKPR